MEKNWKVLTISAVIFFISLIPRVYRIELEGVNPDEPVWHGRIKNFVSAVSEGNFFYTQQSLHPAVTMEWLTALGRVAGGYQDTVFPYDSPETFHKVRSSQIFPIAFTISLSVALMFLFLYILTEHFTLSLISTLLISLNPFYTAHSRVFQMDGLLSSFMILSLLSLLVHIRNGKLKWLAVSGFFGGLSILTKLPALFLIPYSLLMLTIGYLEGINYKLDIGKSEFWIGFYNTVIKKLVIWGIILSAVFVILYPAVWVAPILSIKNLIWGLIGRGLTDTHPGTDFFLGRIVDGPDWRFYPIILALRTTPIAFVFGVIGAFYALWFLFDKRNRHSPRLGPALTPQAGFLLFTLMFLLQMTIVSKKGGRYILPSILGFNLLAGFGIVLFIEWVGKAAKLKYRILSTLLITLIFVSYFTDLRSFKGHYLSYYNTLFGGARSAKEKVVVGWGEGLYEAASYLNDKGGVVGYYGEGMRPLIRGEFHNLIEEPEAKADFIVLYINQVQRGRHPGALDRYYYSQKPIHTIEINGIEYAWIFKTAPNP